MRSKCCSRRQVILSSLTMFGAGGFGRTLLAAGNSEAGEVPWLDAVQTPPAGFVEGSAPLGPPLLDADGRPIDTLAGWESHRAVIRAGWLDFLGPLASRERGPAPPLETLQEDQTDGVIRQLVRYEAAPGEPVEGYLLKPPRLDKPVPGVVALHSTVNSTIRQPAGVEGAPEKAFGLNMARRGYVAFCPRCFVWPSDLESDADKRLGFRQRVDRLKQRHPCSRGIAKMLHDAMRAVDILADLPNVDPQRLGAVGHSLGGKEVLYLAAFDERIRVAVSSEGGIGMRFSNWDAPWYLGPRINDESFSQEHHELLALVAPRAFLLLGGNAADGGRSWPFIRAVLPIYRLYGGPARIGLFVHEKGHAVPPEAEERTYQWLTTYLH